MSEHPYWKGAYRFHPDQHQRRLELQRLRDERELSAPEREELSWLIFSHTNYLLDRQKNPHT